MRQVSWFRLRCWHADCTSSMNALVRKGGTSMVDRLRGAAWLAVALIAIVFAGVLTPLCPMAGCNDAGTVACGDYKPACDKCPDAVVMKHDPGDAVTTSPVTMDNVAVLGTIAWDAAPAPVALAYALPEVTASPPPVDPLGVRLIV